MASHLTVRQAGRELAAIKGNRLAVNRCAASETIPLAPPRQAQLRPATHGSMHEHDTPQPTTTATEDRLAILDLIAQ